MPKTPESDAAGVVESPVMGRKAADELRSRNIPVRWTDDEGERIDELAKAAGLTSSSWIRMMVLPLLRDSQKGKGKAK